MEAARAATASVDRLDLLLNCAGILHPSGRGETSLKDVSQAVSTEGWIVSKIGEFGLLEGLIEKFPTPPRCPTL